ncbi:MAG: cytochrome-c peroxidase [Deltaproteobacteria bacterium]|nr:cytochrome-c peroxidase [Deltaproteobacteria bacterium]
MQLVLSFVFYLFATIALSSTASATEPLPYLPPIPSDNTMSPAKIELGKMLFFDPRLSSSEAVSCASCHNPSFAFTDRIPRALGHKHQVGPRNTPTVLNSAFLKNQFWDGRATTLEDQALGPIQAPGEMNEKLENVVVKLKSIPAYAELFKESFGDKDPVTPANIAKALAAFERTLTTLNAPFDRYIMGDEEAISPGARRGWALFQNKGCVGCHSGANFSNSGFFRIQVPGSTDLGRFEVTKKEEDKYKFRVQSLRNIALTYPYFNNGSVRELSQAVRIMAREMLKIEPKDDEVRDIVAFLESLSGDMPKFNYPVLP